MPALLDTEMRIDAGVTRCAGEVFALSVRVVLLGPRGSVLLGDAESMVLT